MDDAAPLNTYLIHLLRQWLKLRDNGLPGNEGDKLTESTRDALRVHDELDKIFKASPGVE